MIDLGCGMGGFVALLRSAGIDAPALTRPDCIAEARRHGPLVIEADVIRHRRGPTGKL